jgi:hypothetical protein
MPAMNNRPIILPQIEIPISALPDWEQFPLECRSELIQALAVLLLHLPQLQTLEEEMGPPGAGNEQRQ